MTFGESCFAVSKTCESIARPARRCNTLGVLECMRLPRPAARMTIFTRKQGQFSRGANVSLSRQLGEPHQELIHRARTLASLPNGPYDERLTAAHVARGKDLGNRSDIAGLPVGRRVGIAARILRHAKRLN